MQSNDNIQTAREKVNRNCWECDNVVKGHGTCMCGNKDRRIKKRRENQRFRREMREGEYTD